LVVWIVPVVTKKRGSRGNNVWPELYKTDTPQLAVIHEGNAQDHYPWISLVSDYIDALVCVSPVAVGATNGIPIPRILIPNPHDLSEEAFWDEDERWQGFLSVQNFKRWKRVDDLVRSIPFIDNDLMKYVAGYGIEQRYMVSKTKVKPEYLCEDEIPGWEGKPIWDRAIAHKMAWLGPISATTRDQIMRRVTCVVDSSYSRRYSKFGGIFNRTIIEAMRCGAIPIVVNFGISNNSKGDNGIFIPNENILVLKYTDSPQEYGQQIEAFCREEGYDREFMQQQNLKLLEWFRAERVAQQYLDLIAGRIKGGVLLSKLSSKVKNKSNSVWLSHFNC
jgi:glycosyltransferase involved in cell wall biosynthesis